MHLDEKQTEVWQPWEKAVGGTVGIWPLGWGERQETRQWKKEYHADSSVVDNVEWACNWVGKGGQDCWCEREEASGCCETVENV